METNTNTSATTGLPPNFWMTHFANPVAASSKDEDVFRVVYPGLSIVRDTGEGEAAQPVMTGHFAVFNEWTEINSLFEGNFLERISPGAFRKTFRENRNDIKVLFQHGRDPQVGDKVLGAVDALSEDERGAFYEVPLLTDANYVRELLPGLEKGLYGASFRFRVMKEEFVDEPEASDENPRAIPERTIKEAKVFEFGPVTFPAYAGATSGIRSLTDEVMLGRFLRDPERARAVMRALETTQDREAAALPEPEPEPEEATTPEEDSRSTGEVSRKINYLKAKEKQPWRL